VTKRSASAGAYAGAPPAAVFHRLTQHDPARFYPRSGILPAVVGVRDQTGDWDAAGQSRVLVLSDGSTVRETLTVVEEPRFAYDLSDFTGVFGRLVTGGHSEWRVTATGAGAAIEWTYSFTSKPGWSLVVAALVRLAWGPYMRRVLPRIAAFTAGPV
jgi:hypothetical protein